MTNCEDINFEKTTNILKLKIGIVIGYVEMLEINSFFFFTFRNRVLQVSGNIGYITRVKHLLNMCF